MRATVRRSGGAAGQSGAGGLGSRMLDFGMRTSRSRMLSAIRDSVLHSLPAIRHSLFTAFAAVLTLATTTGCQATLPRHATSQPSPHGNAELMEYLAEQPFATAEPVYRSVYTLWKGEPFEGDFDALRGALAAGGIVDRLWGHEPATIMNCGGIGYMVCKACGIKTGVNWLLTDSGRYAWRELQYRGIASGKSEFSYLSGGEFLGLLSRADEYVHKHQKGATSQPALGERRK